MNWKSNGWLISDWSGVLGCFSPKSKPIIIITIITIVIII